MAPQAFEPGSFDYIWEKVIQPMSMTALVESDPDFADWCGLRRKSAEEWKDGLRKEYHRLREQLKSTCYGPPSQRKQNEMLDGKKIAAVVCASLISKKGFQFSSEKAATFTSRKKRELSNRPALFTRWATGNVYINYKLAYYASLQLVYLTLMRDLLVKAGLKDEGQPELTAEQAREREYAAKLAVELNKSGRLISYPQSLVGDSFDVNIIIGLARTDMSVKDLDMFLFAMQLYQIEEHTMDLLREDLTKEEKAAPR